MRWVRAIRAMTFFEAVDKHHHAHTTAPGWICAMLAFLDNTVIFAQREVPGVCFWSLKRVGKMSRTLCASPISSSLLCAALSSCVGKVWKTSGVLSCCGDLLMLLCQMLPDAFSGLSSTRVATCFPRGRGGGHMLHCEPNVQVLAPSTVVHRLDSCCVHWKRRRDCAICAPFVKCRT